MHTGENVDTCVLTTTNRVGIIRYRVPRGDAYAIEGIHNFLEAGEVHHQRVVNLHAVEVAEHLAEGRHRAVWEDVRIATR